MSQASNPTTFLYNRFHTALKLRIRVLLGNIEHMSKSVFRLKLEILTTNLLKHARACSGVCMRRKAQVAPGFESTRSRWSTRSRKCALSAKRGSQHAQTLIDLPRHADGIFADGYQQPNKRETTKPASRQTTGTTADSPRQSLRGVCARQTRGRRRGPNKQEAVAR